MKTAGITGKSGKAVGVLCHADGTVTVALSGEQQVVSGIIERLKGLLPDNFRFAPPHVDVPNLVKAELPGGKFYKGGGRTAPRPSCSPEPEPSPARSRRCRSSGGETDRTRSQ